MKKLFGSLFILASCLLGAVEADAACGGAGRGRLLLGGRLFGGCGGGASSTTTVTVTRGSAVNSSERTSTFERTGIFGRRVSRSSTVSSSSQPAGKEKTKVMPKSDDKKKK